MRRKSTEWQDKAPRLGAYENPLEVLQSLMALGAPHTETPQEQAEREGGFYNEKV